MNDLISSEGFAVTFAYIDSEIIYSGGKKTYEYDVNLGYFLNVVKKKKLEGNADKNTFTADSVRLSNQLRIFQTRLGQFTLL